MIRCCKCRWAKPAEFACAITSRSKPKPKRTCLCSMICSTTAALPFGSRTHEMRKRMSALLAPEVLSIAPRPEPRTAPVRVCFMVDRLSRAGTESQLLALIKNLDRGRVDPTLVLLDGEDDLSRVLEPTDCPVVRLGVRKLLGLTAAKAARRLRSFWRETRPDV